MGYKYKKRNYKYYSNKSDNKRCVIKILYRIYKKQVIFIFSMIQSTRKKRKS